MSKRMLLLGVVAAVCLLFGAMAFLPFPRNDRRPGSETPTSTAQSVLGQLGNTFAPALAVNPIAESDFTKAAAQADTRQWYPPRFESTPLDEPPSTTSAAIRIDATIINPFRNPTVGSEVGGIIDAFNFEPGDFIKEGNVVLEISKKRYSLAARKAQEKLEALKTALRRAEKDREIKEKLVTLDASSMQDLLRAEAEVEITQYRIQEAQTELDQALLDLQSCQVKAPFSGYLALRYREAHEVVPANEKLFLMVDSSKVFAVANVPEHQSDHFKRGDSAIFRHVSGREFIGTVARVEPVIDPKTDTRRISVLIDNPAEDLVAGMTGSLAPGQ